MLTGGRHVERLGHPHAVERDDRLQPDRLPPGHDLAARQRHLRRRLRALRAGRRGAQGRRRAARGDVALPRSAPARAVLRLRPRRRRRCPCRTRSPARPRPGPPARCSTWSAPRSACSPTAREHTARAAPPVAARLAARAAHPQPAGRRGAGRHAVAGSATARSRSRYCVGRANSTWSYGSEQRVATVGAAPRRGRDARAERLGDAAAGCRAAARARPQRRAGRRSWPQPEAIVSDGQAEPLSRASSSDARAASRSPTSAASRSSTASRSTVDPRALIPRPETELLVDLGARADRAPCSIDEPRPDRRAAAAGVGRGHGQRRHRSRARRRVPAARLRRLTSAFGRPTSRPMRCTGRRERRRPRGRRPDRLRAGRPDRRADDAGPPTCCVANLPYIPSDVVPTLPVAASFEPVAALDGGADGLGDHRAAADRAARRSRREGRGTARDRRRSGSRASRRAVARRCPAGRSTSTTTSPAGRASAIIGRPAVSQGASRAADAGAIELAARRALARARSWQSRPRRSTASPRCRLEAAVERLVAAKQRSTEKGIQLLVDSLEQVAVVALLTRGRRAARRGVLARRPDARPAIGARTSICPSCSAAAGRRSACACPITTCRALLARLLGPLAASSANISGQPDATTAELVAAALGEEVALIVDDGPVRGGVPSTVVDCSAAADRAARAARRRHQCAGDRRGSRPGLNCRAEHQASRRPCLAAWESDCERHHRQPAPHGRPLSEVDPELWSAMVSRARAPALEHRADRQRELRLCRRFSRRRARG